MNQRALWMGQFLQAAGVPFWITLPICRVSILGPVCWPDQGLEEWACTSPVARGLAWLLRACPQCCCGFGGARDKRSLSAWPSWVYASYWQQWVNFSNRFRKHLTVIMSPKASTAKFLTSSGLCKFHPPGICGATRRGTVVAYHIMGSIDFGIIFLFISKLQKLYSLWLVWPSTD